MTPADNNLLTELHRLWQWNADWMTCRACGRNLIASRDGEPLVHVASCRNSTQKHPWRLLREILNSSPPKTRGDQ